MNTFGTTSEQEMLKTGSPRNSRSSFKRRLAALLLIGSQLAAAPAAWCRSPGADPSFLPPPATPQPSTGAYKLLKEKAESMESTDRTEGWAYLVSGAVVLGISIPAYYLSTDLFAQAGYSAGQTLGLGAMGYGASLAFQT